MFRNLQQGAFNGFDPDVNAFDPQVTNKFNGANGDEAGYNTQDAKPGQKMQVNLTLANPTASNLTFEMFSYLDSLVRRRKTEYAVAAFLYHPLLTFEGIPRLTADTGGIVGFNELGDLEIWGANAAAARGKISCSEIGYASFFEASGVTAFQVAYVRFTCQTDSQIDQIITYFQKSFSGGIKENPVSPRAYFRPNQFQGKTIDITVSFSIGIDKGIRTILLAGESVRLAFFIQMWTNQTLG
jgi:hypothetical protein